MSAVHHAGQGATAAASFPDAFAVCVAITSLDQLLGGSVVIVQVSQKHWSFLHSQFVQTILGSVLTRDVMSSLGNLVSLGVVQALSNVVHAAMTRAWTIRFRL
jgi:hypothetical protein